MVDGSFKQGGQRLLAWCGRQRAVDGDADRDADRATKADMEKSMINAAGAMTRDPGRTCAPNFRRCSWVGNAPRR
jgi:hypothetical protein